jgi:hypothetical protein
LTEEKPRKTLASGQASQNQASPGSLHAKSGLQVQTSLLEEKPTITSSNRPLIHANPIRNDKEPSEKKFNAKDKTRACFGICV